MAAVTPTDDIFCYHFDGTGSTIAVTDENQDMVNTYSYYPFGIILGEQEGFDQPFKYVGQYGVMAEPNGLYYMRARYYDAETARFIFQDPIGFDGGSFNLYAYVQNNPVMFMDPNGLCVRDAWEGVTNTLFPEDNRPIHEKVAGYVNWYVNHSGLEQTPAVFTASAAVTAGALIGTLYEPAMVFAGTPQGQSILNEFLPAIVPGTPPAPTPYGLIGNEVGGALGFPGGADNE